MSAEERRARLWAWLNGRVDRPPLTETHIAIARDLQRFEFIIDDELEGLLA
jgi:hypothetical protein